MIATATRVGDLPLVASADSSSLLLKPSPAVPASSADSAAVTGAASSSDAGSGSSAEAGAESDTSHLLSSWEMLRLCIPVIPSQLGWAVGEALLIPYLMSLGLAETTANSIWLVNPLVGFFVQPIIGAWSDRSTSRWGRRRPFLLLFHLGIVAGLLMIGFAPELHSLLLPHLAAYHEDGTPSASLLGLIFSGCVLMELSNDLLTIPSRALLNDNLPEEQIDQGNAWFSAMNSLGAVIGLTMCFLPLNEIWPLRLLGTQMRATFVMCIAFIMTSNFFTMTIDEWMGDEDEEEEEGEGEDAEEEGEGEGEGEGEEVEGQPLLAKELEEGRLQQRAGKMRTVQEEEADETGVLQDKTSIVVELPEGQAEAEAEAEEEAEGEGEEEEEEAEAPSHMSLLSSLLAFRLLPPALLAIWVAQFSWWLVVMQISFWWTTWVGIDVYGGDPLSSSALFYEGVTFGIVGTLVHSIVSFFASQLLTKANNLLGVTRVYHASAVLFSLSTMALWWLRSREASMLYMVFTGALYPVINTNPFILIEVYTGYDEEGDGGEGGDDEGEEEGAGEDEADTGKQEAAEPEEGSSGQQAAAAAASAVRGAQSAAEAESGDAVTAGPLSDFLYQSQNETDSGSSVSSSSSSDDSETDSPLFAASPSLASLAPPAMKRPVSDGAVDSVSESEGSQSETEYKASPTQRGAGGGAGSAARSLNLSQYGYDLSVSVNEGYAFSDGESVTGAAAAGRRREASPLLSPYGSPLPLASLLPLALQSASHGQPSSPDTPLSPDSPLTPLVSPGMVATVAAQHAQGGVQFLAPAIPSSEPPSPQSPALSFDSATQSPLPPAASASFSRHGGSPALAARRPTLSPSDSGGVLHGTSIYQPEHGAGVEEADAGAEVAAVSWPSSGSSAQSIEAAIARRTQPRSSKSTPLHSPSSVPAAASSLLPARPLEALELKEMESKQQRQAADVAAAAEAGEGEDEEEAEEELEAAEDAEIEYLKASTHRGVLTAIMNLSMGLSQIISATVGGVLISWWGDITIVFFLSGLLSLIVNAVVMAYGWSSVAEEAAEEEAAEGEAEDELAEKAELAEEAEAERRRLEQERRRREEKREEEERKRRAEQEAVKRKDRDRILRRFMPGEHSRLPSREGGRDQRSIGLLSPEPDAAAISQYGSFGSAVGVPIPSIPHRRPHRHAHRHRSDDAELAQPSSSVPSSSHRRHRHRHHGHRHRASSPSELDRQHAQAYLMHALAQMSRLHSSSGAGGAAHSRKLSRPGTAGKKAAAGESKRQETSELTPLLTGVPGPSPMLHASSQPVVSTPSTQPAAALAVPALTSTVSAGHAAPLHSLLSHPSHQRLLYEITVLLHYYHVHHISLLPHAVQDRIFLRLRKQLTKLRRRLPHHGRIDADITSRRGLSGRYAMGEEVKMERERLHLMKKRRRRRIRRKERERRDREDRLQQTEPTAATTDTQQQPQTP